MSVAQIPTDLFLFQLHQSPNLSYHVSQAKFLSGFNRGGYTNQPWFTSSGDLLVSVRKVGETQNDIYLLSLKSNRIKRITQTTSNEYSPRVHPDGKHVTVLRQVEGTPIDQQIFQFEWDDGAYTSLTPDMKDIGYYAWMSDDEMGLYRIEGEGNRMEYFNLEEGKSRKITSSIGRSLISDGKGHLLYVHKFTSDYWYIKKYDPSSSVVDIVTQTPGKTEDFALAPDGTYFMGRDQKLFFFHPGHHTAWKELADLSIYGIDQITRLAVSPDGKQLVLVSTKETE